MSILKGVIAVILLMFAWPAFADIKAYNAAVNARDYATASAEAETIWKTFDKTRPEAAVTAREFAWTSMLARQPAKAAVYARWLVEEGQKLPTPDDDRLLSKVMLLWAEIGDNPTPAARDALSGALSAWNATNSNTGVRIGVAAAVQLYGLAWQAADWKDVDRDAAIAASAAGRLGVEGLIIQQRAILDSAVGDFMATKTADGWIRIADAMDALAVRLSPPRPGMGVDLGELEPVYWRAQAWLEAMSAYFSNDDSVNTSLTFRAQGRLIEARRKTLKGRCGDQPCLIPQPPGTLPKCLARWDQSPRLIYPQTAVFRDMIGATILRLTTDEAGAVTDAVVLAAVPNEVFPEAAIRAVRKWTLKPEGETTTPCTLAGTRELRVFFQMK